MQILEGTVQHGQGDLLDLVGVGFGERALHAAPCDLRVVPALGRPGGQLAKAIREQPVVVACHARPPRPGSQDARPVSAPAAARIPRPAEPPRGLPDFPLTPDQYVTIWSPMSRTRTQPDKIDAPRVGEEDAEDLLFKALADRTRRAILDVLREGPRTTGDLSQRFEMTRFGVMKHLGVLESAGLILIERRGRERWNHLNAVPIQKIGRRWLRPFEKAPADRLLKLARVAEAKAAKRAAERKPKVSAPTNAPAADTPAAVKDLLMEIVIDAPRDVVWQSLVENTTEWWPDDFYTAATKTPDRNPRFLLEPRLGGWMYEDWGDGEGLVWGQTIGVMKNERLQVVGDASPDWGGPARGFLQWDLADEGDGGTQTRLRFRHSIHGNITDDTIASLNGGWRLLFEDALKQHAESRA